MNRAAALSPLSFVSSWGEMMTDHRVCRSHPSGFSLLEMIISFVLLIALIGMVTQFIMSGTSAQKLAERMSRVTEVTQDAAATIRQELQSSVRLFTDDALGNAYLPLMDRSGMPANTSVSLPASVPAGIFEPEPTAASVTGNQLLFARYAWTTRFRTTSGSIYSVDVYRLVHYYLAEAGDGPQPANEIGLNLCKFVSEPLVAGDQVDAIGDPVEQAEVLEHIRTGTADADGNLHPTTNLVWELGGDPSNATTLRQITTTNTLSLTSSAPRDSPWEIEADPSLSSPGLLFFRHHSVATNYAPGAFLVGRFSVRDDTLGTNGFPHGFEIQQVGPSAARKVLIRLVVTTTNNAGRRPAYRMELIADCRDV